MDFSKLIKKYRNIKFLTQKDFAELLGVTNVTVNRWENKQNEPTMKQKRMLYDLFKKEGLI